MCDAGRAILFDRCLECVDTHPELGVRRNPAQRMVAEAEQDDGFVDRRVRLVRAVHCERRAWRQPVGSNRGNRALARGGEGMQRRDRRRVVDDAFEGVG